MNIEFTAFYAGILSLFYIGLSFRVISLRRKYKVGINDGQQKELSRAIRANFAEYVPITIFLIFLLEINQASNLALHLLGSGLFIGRILHALGLDKSAGTSLPRMIGMILTFLVIIVAAVMNILTVY